MSPNCLRFMLAGVLFWGVLLGVELTSDGPRPGHPTHAANALTPLTEISFRPRVVAADQRVSFLDLCQPENVPEDWKTLLAGIDLGTAPDVGSPKFISGQNLRAYLEHLFKSQGIDPDQVQVTLPDKIVVERQQMPVTMMQVEKIFREFILARIAINPEDVVVQLTDMPQLPVLPAGALDIEVFPVTHEPFIGNVTVTIQFIVDGKRIQSLNVAGKVGLYQNVVYARRMMKRNDTIGAEDIQVVRTSTFDHPERVISQPEQVIGKRLVCGVGINQPIGSHMLDKALTVKRGDMVVIVCELDGLTLTAKGQAKENGSQGDKIKVVNVDSHKSIFCNVLDARTVALTP
jgi:flagella basal body P-ring formation protein FlgA